MNNSWLNAWCTTGGGAPSVRVVRHDERVDELEGPPPDIIINHHRIDGEGNRVDPGNSQSEGDQ